MSPTPATPRHPDPEHLNVNRRLDDVVDRRGDLGPMTLMRVLLGLIVVRHLWPDLTATTVPVERFHVPWWSWLPVPSPTGYRLLLWLGVAAGLAMVAGALARAATITAFAVVTYLLWVDMTGFAHNRGFLVWMLFGLTLVPTGGIARTGRSIGRVGRWATRRSRSWRPDAIVGPVWPVLLLQVVVSSVYLTSGLTKLANPDWRSGLVLWDRVVRHEHLIPVDGWMYDVLISRAFHRLVSPSAIAVELFLGIGLWFGRTRATAVVVAILFHVSIEIAASVQTFSYSALAALLIWSIPTTRRWRERRRPATAPGAAAPGAGR